MRLHYELEGAGPPIVLHTGGGGDLEMWRLAGFAAALRSDHRLLLIDHRGRGKSDRPHDRDAHRIEEYCNDVRAILDAARVEDPVFFGYSDGAKVGVAFAQRNPDRISALIDLDGLEPCDLSDPER